jgi:uncharacterized protein UPF0167
MTTFRYFPTFPEGARFDARPCAFCGATPALDDVWLDVDEDYDDPPPVCVADLLRDRARVAIPAWIEQDLADQVATAHPEWDDQRKAAYVAARTAELAHTPPVPWVQENEWPVCADDYAGFDGELTRERLEHRYGGPREAQAALGRIIADLRPAWQLNAESLDAWWQRLGGFVRVYAFRCPKGEETYVLQTM